jgi:hypothetical protein
LEKNSRGGPTWTISSLNTLDCLKPTLKNANEIDYVLDGKTNSGSWLLDKIDAWRTAYKPAMQQRTKTLTSGTGSPRPKD